MGWEGGTHVLSLTRLKKDTETSAMTIVAAPVAIAHCQRQTNTGLRDCFAITAD